MSDRPLGPMPLPMPSGGKLPVPLLSVWPTGQRELLAQLRDSGCVPGTETDPHLIPPAVAAHAITTYTHPGDLILDPDCGTGTVLVEALRVGRHALGLTTQQRGWALARANITAAKRDGAWRDGSVLDAHPKVLAGIRAAGLVGRVGLVLTALRPRITDSTDGPDGDSDTELDRVLADLTTTLSYCEPLLRSAGHVVIVAQPRRHPDGALVDLPTRLIAAAAPAGLVPVERCVALTAALRRNRLITRASLAERRTAARAQGAPAALTAHHEVLVFQPAHDAELAAVTARIPTPKHTVAVVPQRTHRGIDDLAGVGGRRAA